MKSWTTLLALALLGASVASAQIVIPKPAPPVLVAPAGGSTLRGQAMAATSFQVKWNQWGVIGSTQQPLPTFFAVCVKPASQAANCSFTPAHFVPTGSIPSVRLFNGLVHSGYQYTLSLPVAGTSIADSLLDIDLTLSVGACRGAGASACSFSPASALYLSARDLRATTISPDHTSTQAVYEHKFRNEGSTEIPNVPFIVSVNEWQALINSMAQCRIDVTAGDVRMNPNVIVFLDSGDGYFMPDYWRIFPTGSPPPPAKVVGMHVWNGGFNIWGANLQFASALPAGLAGQTDYSFPVPGSERAKGFITYTFADSTHLVREFDEANNRRAACNVVPAPN